MINQEYIEKKIKQVFNTKTAFVQSLGIELGSLNDWFRRGVIPSSRISEVLSKLEIFDESEIDIALGLPVVQTSYRAKYKDLSESEVDNTVKLNTKYLSKTFFALTSAYQTSETLESLWKDIGERRDPYYVASLIRKIVDITDTTPFNFTAVNYTLEKFGINTFTIPFKSFGLSVGDGENRALAFTSKLESRYFVVCDSDRTMDEAAFDLTHELVHIFTGLIGDKISRDDEAFIDHVTEELIYPKLFIERELGPIFSKKRVSKEDFINRGFRKMISNYEFFAPRGLARTLERLEHLGNRQAAYNWMHDEEHAFYLKHVGKTLTESGSMQIDFSDAYELEDFINNFVESNPRKYPLFYNLCQGLVDSNITPRSFSKLFGIDAGEADELKKNWKGKFKVNLGL